MANHLRLGIRRRDRRTLLLLLAGARWTGHSLCSLALNDVVQFLDLVTHRETMTRMKVAGMEVESFDGLVFCSLNRVSS